MKAVIAVVVLALAALCSPSAKAWNCPTGQIRQQAPAGTPTNTPNYDVVEGIAFICVPANPPTSGSNTNTNTNQNSNSNSNSNKSSSTSTATGGTGIGIGVGGNSSSTVKDSGNSNVKNTVSVDPKITTTNEQTQQQGQKQSQKQSISNSGNSSSESAAIGNGDNSNNTFVPRQTATAVAPMVLPTVPCFKGFGVGAQGPAFGASFGGGKIDPNCATLETARSFLAAGSRVAYCKTMLSTKYAQNAGVTMEDCMGVQDVVIPAAPVMETAPVNPVTITNNIPAPIVTVVPAPVVPTVDVAQVAAVHKAEKQHAKKHAPCVTDDSIKK